ncbi:S-layer family protein [Candidatus Saccharibacteria bacterium]|nr:MAG: S-layer family protein [Candidatus Saccharibacteria bacterium]
MAYQYPLNGGRINASIGGNSTSAGAGYSLISTGTMLLAGGNNITLSQNGSAVTISGGNGVALYDGANSISSGTARISAGGGLTASINGQTLSLSAPVVSSVSATGIVSISNNGSTVSIGAPAYSAGISTNGNTSGTTGFATNQLLFAGGNNITLSQSTGTAGNTLTISAANQSNQTLGYYASGNTTGQSSSSTFDARSVSVSAVGGISAGYSGSALQLSAPAQSSLSATGIFSISANGSTISMGAPAYSAGISTNGNTSGTTGFATNQLLFAGGNNITLSQSTGAGGNTLTISAANQTNQSLGLYAVSNTTQSTSGTVDARTLSFQGAGNVSVGISNGSVIVSGGGGAGGGIALANSQTTYTSGTANLLEGGGAITIASTTGQKFNISVPTVSSLSATGAVSISNNAGTISIGAPSFSGGMSNLGNTSGSTGTVTNGLYFAGGNNITLSQSTNGASAATITVSAAAQTNQTANFYVSSNSTQLSSTAGIDLRSVTFQGAGGASFGLSQGKVLVSVNSTYAASNHSHGNPTLALTNISGTTASASNGLTLSLSANGPDGIVAMSAGTQSVSTGTMNFVNSNGITFGMSNSNQITASYTVPTQTNQTLGLYGGGNTTGQSSSSTFDARTLSFQGAGAASVGYSNGSVVISAPNAAAGNVTVSAGGNSAGLASIVFSNSNGVSFGLNGSTITASAAGGAGGGIALANSQTTYTNGTANLNVAGGAMTIASTTGQSFNFSVPATSSLSVTGALSLSTNGSTVSIGAPASSSIQATGGLLSVSTNGSTIFLGLPGLMPYHMHNSAAVYSSSSSAMVNASVSLVRMLIPQHLSFTRVEIPVTVSGTTSATANTAGWAFSSVGVIYSRNGSTLNPIIGQSSNTTYSYNSNNTSSFNGPRMISFGLATTLSAGEYYFGMQISTATSSIGTATTAPALTFAPIYGTSYSAAPWQGIGSATNASINLYQPLQGMNSVTISNTSQTFQQSQITQSGATAIRANLVVLFRNN